MIGGLGSEVIRDSGKTAFVEPCGFERFMFVLRVWLALVESFLRLELVLGFFGRLWSQFSLSTLGF